MGSRSDPHLRVGLQVVVEHVDGDGQVARVEGVAAVPALRPELAALGHHGVEVAQGEENAFELILASAHLQRVLGRAEEEEEEGGYEPGRA